jgi:hypothetical protein
MQDKTEKTSSSTMPPNQSSAAYGTRDRKTRKSTDSTASEEIASQMGALNFNLSAIEPVNSKRRITSQDWVSARSLNNETCSFPSGFSFNDTPLEDDPHTSALISFSESQSEFEDLNQSQSEIEGLTESFEGLTESQRSTLSYSTQESMTCQQSAFNCTSQELIESQRSVLTSSTQESTRSLDQVLAADNGVKIFCVPTDLDVLLGRGGLTNNHAGNIRYREEVEKVKPMYFSSRTKTEKKNVSEMMVAYVEDYGGRFLAKDPDTGQWMIAPAKAARKKASQALRETKWKQLNKESPG